MLREEFEQLVAEEFEKAVPEKFQSLIHNVVFLVEDEPSAEVREEEGLGSNETLLGLYRGVPATARDTFYGVGGTLPDTITLFQTPIEQAAREEDPSTSLDSARDKPFETNVRKVIRETIWHEVAHHFGYDESQVRGREETEGR